MAICEKCRKDFDLNEEAIAILKHLWKEVKGTPVRCPNCISEFTQLISQKEALQVQNNELQVQVDSLTAELAAAIEAAK